MSTDRLTEILNYLTAINRDVGEFRAEVNARLERIGRGQRLQGRRLDRIEGIILTMRADVSELSRPRRGARRRARLDSERHDAFRLQP